MVQPVVRSVVRSSCSVLMHVVQCGRVLVWFRHLCSVPYSVCCRVFAVLVTSRRSYVYVVSHRGTHVRTPTCQAQAHHAFSYVMYAMMSVVYVAPSRGRRSARAGVSMTSGAQCVWHWARDCPARQSVAPMCCPSERPARFAKQHKARLPGAPEWRGTVARHPQVRPTGVAGCGRPASAILGCCNRIVSGPHPQRARHTVVIAPSARRSGLPDKRRAESPASHAGVGGALRTRDVPPMWSTHAMARFTTHDLTLGQRPQVACTYIMLPVDRHALTAPADCDAPLPSVYRCEQAVVQTMLCAKSLCAPVIPGVSVPPSRRRCSQLCHTPGG